MSDGPKLTVFTNTNASNMRAITGESGDAEIKKPVIISPLLQGPHGKAWLCDMEVGLKLAGIKPEDDACLAHWLIEAPWAHPLWHSYSITLCHLRPMPDGRITKLYNPDATHEFVLWAVDPAIDRDEVIKKGYVKGMWLRPKNFAAQFIELTDDLAKERIKQSVRLIVDGKLSPDVDYQREWIKLYTNWMMKEGYK
jgi:hypothetical protein